MLLYSLNLTPILKPMVRNFLVSTWALILSSSWLGTLLGAVEWPLVGWAFAGSTAFVMYESTMQNPPRRTGKQRASMIAVGLFVSGMCVLLIQKGSESDVVKALEAVPALGQIVSLLFNMPLEIVAGLTGAMGYKYFDKYQRKAHSDQTDPTP